MADATDLTNQGSFPGDLAGASIIAFGDSLLACRPGALARRLSPYFVADTTVDLAGQCRPLLTPPVLDRVGALHLVAATPTGIDHVVVTPGGFTRRTRSITGVDRTVTSIGVNDQQLILVAARSVGVWALTGGSCVTWIPTSNTEGHQP